MKDTSKDVPQAKVEDTKSNRQRRQSAKQQKSSALPEKPQLPETEVSFEDDMPAETKCTEYSEVESVVSIPSPSRHRQLEVTSSVVKRLRQRSGMY